MISKQFKTSLLAFGEQDVNIDIHSVGSDKEVIIEIESYRAKARLYVIMLRRFIVYTLILLIAAQLGAAKSSFGEPWWWFIETGERGFLFIYLFGFIGYFFYDNLKRRYILRMTLIHCDIRDERFDRVWYISLTFWKCLRTHRIIYRVSLESIWKALQQKEGYNLEISGRKYYFHVAENYKIFSRVVGRIVANYSTMSH